MLSGLQITFFPRKPKPKTLNELLLDFINAARAGNIHLVNELLEDPRVAARADVNDPYSRDKIKDFWGSIRIPNGALLAAIRGGHINVVNRLLEVPCVKQLAISNSQINFVYNTLDSISEHGRNLDIALRLLQIPEVFKNVTQNEFYSTRNGLIMKAAHYGHFELFKMLFQDPNINTQLTTFEQRNLLDFASKSPELKAVHLMLTKQIPTRHFQLHWPFTVLKPYYPFRELLENDTAFLMSTIKSTLNKIAEQSLYSDGTRRAPFDYEYDIIEILTAIARKGNITLDVHFTHTERDIFDNWHPVRSSLSFHLLKMDFSSLSKPVTSSITDDDDESSEEEFLPPCSSSDINTRPKRRRNG